MGAAPSAFLWLWASLGADCAHFACFSFVLGVWWGPRPVWLWAPLGADFDHFAFFLWLCWAGGGCPSVAVGLSDVAHFLYFRLFWVSRGGCALGPSVAVGPS